MVLLNGRPHRVHNDVFRCTWRISVDDGARLTTWLYHIWSCCRFHAALFLAGRSHRVSGDRCWQRPVYICCCLVVFFFGGWTNRMSNSDGERLTRSLGGCPCHLVCLLWSHPDRVSSIRSTGYQTTPRSIHWTLPGTFLVLAQSLVDLYNRAKTVDVTTHGAASALRPTRCGCPGGADHSTGICHRRSRSDPPTLETSPVSSPPLQAAHVHALLLKTCVGSVCVVSPMRRTTSCQLVQRTFSRTQDALFKRVRRQTIHTQ
mmetsp:Transcript_48489/g.128463  ORF Transcript_48489/g.128463 Transcript_48489/m.128463 type:complete len:260 (+) Transcript_48489:1443-2222(+)